MATAPRPAWLPLGALLVREGLVTHEQLELALMEQEVQRRRLGEILVEWGWVESREVARALAEQYGLVFVNLVDDEPDFELAPLLPEPLARRHQALAIRKLPDGLVLVAVADPTNVAAGEELREAAGRPIRLAVADAVALADALDRAYGRLGASA